MVGAEALAGLAVLWWPLFQLDRLSFSYKNTGIPVMLDYSWKAPLALASDLFLAPGLAALLAAALASWKRIPKYWLAVAVVALLILMPLPGFAEAVKGHLELWFFNIPLGNFKLVLWASLAFLAPEGLRALLEARRGVAWLAATSAP